MSNFFDFLNRPFYKNIDLEQKKQLLDEIVQLYFWSRYRIHTLAISLLRRSSTKKKTIEIGRKFIFHFFNVECSTVFPFATISKELIAYHLEKYLVELEKRVTSILGKLGLKEILAIQVEKLFDQVVTDLSLGIKTVFQTEYQNQPNDHNKTFYSRRTPNNVSVCSSGKNSALLEFTISQEKIVLPLTQNVIRVRQKLGGCPHPERTSSLVVCPHRTQE